MVDMDIFALQQHGSARRDAGRLELRFPIRFAWVDTLDRVLILDCLADGPAAVDGAAAPHVGRPAIYFGSDELEPARLPVTLRVQNEEDRSNDVWLAFTLRLPDGAATADESTVDIRFRLAFHTGITIPFTARVVVNASGHCVVESLERRGQRPAIVRNLAFLGVVVLLAEVWALLAHDVYNLPAFASPHIISLIVGAALAFLGVSVLRIRSWFTTLAHASGVMRFPEVHVPRLTCDLLGTRFASVALPLAIVLFGAHWGFNAPLEVARTELPTGYRLVDLRHDNAVVHHARVRVRDVLSGALGVLCGPERPDGKPTLLARLGFSWLTARPVDIEYAVSFPPHLDIGRSGGSLDSLVTARVSGMDLPAFDLAAAPDIVPEAVCGGAAAQERIEVVFETDSAAAMRGDVLQPRAIFVLDDPPAKWRELYTHVNQLRENRLKTLYADSLWVVREAFVASLSHAIDSVSSRTLAPGDLVRLIQHYWEDELGPETAPPERGKTIERTIMIRALIRHFERHPHERLGSEHVDSVAALFVRRFGATPTNELNFRVYRSGWEVLLELERLRPDAAPTVHAAIVRNLRGDSPGNIGAEPALQYLRAFITLGLHVHDGALDQRRAFFHDMAGTIGQRTEISRPDDIVDYLMANDHTIRSTLQADALFAPIRSLFPPTLASGAAPAS
jgi:hypothetical protein